jgi:hypothetical protein
MYYLVAPDMLADGCGLSLGLMLLMVPAGLFLWLLGWWSHRFWVVLGTTVLAGICGLNIAPTFHAPPLVAALLLAFSAGVLALAMVRLIAFAAGGVAGLLLVQATYPGLNQPLIVFLVSGLLCLALFRPCMMALTSLAGALLLIWGALMLLNHYALLDAPAWSERSAVLLNWIAGLLALLGALVQFLFDRYLFLEKTKSKSWLGELRLILAPRNGGGAKSAPAKKAA